MIHVSQELAKHGHEMTVYTHTKKEEVYDGVRWVPLRPDGKFKDRPASVDVAIAYDSPQILMSINAHVRILENQTNNPTLIGLPDGLIDMFVFKSEWHKTAVSHVTPTLPLERCVVISNGINISLYADRANIKKVPNRLIWTSSPDRGLHHALRIFERVQREIPDATFHVYYNFDNAFESSKYGMDYRTECLWRAKRLLQTVPNVTYFGAVDKKTLAQAQMEAQMLLFPEDTITPTEGFGISVGEAMAAGAMALLSTCDCLPEVWGPASAMLSLPINDIVWADAVCELLGDHEKRSMCVVKGYEHVENFSWDRVGGYWNTLVTELYNTTPCPYCSSLIGSDTACPVAA